MKLHRFIGDFDLTGKSIDITEPELVNQIKNVLKLKVGEAVILGDGKLNEANAEIFEIRKDVVRLNIKETFKNQNEPENHVTLYCSVLKKENFELVVQKATEIGVNEIVPIISARTIKLNIRQDRLDKIIREAAEQSGRGKVPKLHKPSIFQEVVGGINNEGLNILFDQSGKNMDLSGLNTSHSELVTIFIGPEGGWTLEEINTAEELCFKIINLSKHTLRAETAAIVASYLVVHN